MIVIRILAATKKADFRIGKQTVYELRSSDGVTAEREIKRHRLSQIHFVWQGRTEADQLEWEISQLLSRIVDANVGNPTDSAYFR